MAMLWPILTSMCLEARAQSEGADVSKKIGTKDQPSAVPPGNLPDTITPLQIGDTIPEYLWHLPLQVVNHPVGKETITLNDYKGRIILFDFLSTRCSGCITSLPKLEATSTAFHNNVAIIPVTPEKREQVVTFVSENTHLSHTQLPFVVEDRILKQYFPHLYISHVVWIDTKGKVRAATHPNHVTVHTLQQLQSGATIDWPVKTENTSFFNAPLITLNAEASVLTNNVNRPLYYAAITGYTEGVGPYKATQQDSLKGIERISYRNRSILELYLVALDQLYRLKPYQIILEVDNPAAYDVAKADLTTLTLDQWHQRHAICYERTVPLGTPVSAQRTSMLADLNSLLNLNGRMEVRNGENCFVLSKIND